MGSPQQVIEKILSYHEAFGHDLQSISLPTTLPFEEQLQILERFSTDVIPVVRREAPTALWTHEDPYGGRPAFAGRQVSDGAGAIEALQPARGPVCCAAPTARATPDDDLRRHRQSLASPGGGRTANSSANVGRQGGFRSWWPRWTRLWRGGRAVFASVGGDDHGHGGQPQSYMGGSTSTETSCWSSASRTRRRSAT